MKCSDCDSVAILSIPERGDGVCSVCHGGGVGDVFDEMADGLNPFGKGHIKCYNCGGSRKCPTCGGTGEV